MRALFGFWLALSLSACAASVSPYARATAGRIGCPAQHIELSGLEREGGGPQSWVAVCGRTSYACSSNGDLSSPRARVVCSELGHPLHAAHRYHHHE